MRSVDGAGVVMCIVLMMLMVGVGTCWGRRERETMDAALSSSSLVVGETRTRERRLMEKLQDYGDPSANPKHDPSVPPSSSLRP